MIIVSLIVLLDWHSALSIIIQIPITVATSFILLNAFGLSSNIMSLTGIALAIGVIVDNGIIMSENAYRHLAEEQHRLPGGARLSGEARIDIIRRACIQVSRGVFFSTVIIIASFLPVFLLTGQEGKLFHPLAAGVTRDSIIRELNSKLQIPGVTNGWTQPIINRINMLSTGIRTDVGVKDYGQSLDSINTQEGGGRIEVRAGLKQGDVVVSEGAYLVNNEYAFKHGQDAMAGMKM